MTSGGNIQQCADSWKSLIVRSPATVWFTLHGIYVHSGVLLALNWYPGMKPNLLLNKVLQILAEQNS